MPVFAINKTLAAIQSLSQSGTQENADIVAGLIGVGLVNNAPDMDEKLLSDNYRDENYRYQDVGYIAGSRKELAQSAIMQAKKLGQLVQINDIDWDELESDPRIAAATITKKNVFGKVDWDGLKAGGMNGNTAYFIKRLYAAIEMQPDVDSPEDRKLYVTAIQTLRDTFESCITMDDATKKIVELSKLLNARKNMIRDDKGELVLNYDAKVAFALGRKFRSWVFNTGNKAIHESVFKMNTKDWSWLEGAEKTASAKPKKASFQLEAAIDCKRVGGAQVSITSTEQFKSVFGLKAVQSGKWVLSDKESIEFHIQRSAESMSDMADITGIPVEMLGFGGRLGLAFGARGKGGALAHYEPTQRVINITKMKGGGSLGHEYFHALDNLMQDLMTQTTNGKADFMATETPEGLPDSPVKASFVALRMAMLIGGTSLTESLKLTDKDFEAVEKGMIPRRIANSEMKQAIVAAGNVFDAVKAVDSYFNGPRMTHPSQKRKFRDKYHMESIRLAAAYYSEKGTDSVKIPSFGKLGSTFLQNSIMLDDDKQGKYWSKPLEMAARAFSAYLQDKLEEQGRVNDYLAYSTKGGNGRVGQEAYPEGEERKAINAAFDQLFKSLKDGQIFEKALGNIGLMDSMFPNFDSIDDQAHESATSPHNDIPEPTLAQKIAGNYKVGKITISGLSISIENPKGSTRSGVDADGNEWSNVMKHHYGYINNTIGADKDHVDVFVKPNTPENFNGNVYVIDQKDPLTGYFDEHKAIIGASSEADAKSIYLANYEKDWDGLAAITALPMAAFKPWVLSSEAKKPLAIFDSLNGNTSLMDALALITSLSKKKSEAVAQQLAVAIGVSIVNPSPTDFNLSTYTESDLRAQEAVLKAAEVKRQADEKAAKDKAIADKQIGDFRLSGSSLPSDVAASYGQNDMFVQTRGQSTDNKPVTQKEIDLMDAEVARLGNVVAEIYKKHFDWRTFTWDSEDLEQKYHATREKMNELKREASIKSGLLGGQQLAQPKTDHQIMTDKAREAEARITSSTFERAQKRLNNDADNWFGRGMSHQKNRYIGQQVEKPVTDNTKDQTKEIKKYKSGSREWQNFCHDSSTKYAKLYQSYMNYKTDYDSFIKKKEKSPLSDDALKNIERIVGRNFYKWREIDIAQYDLKPEYLEAKEKPQYDDLGGFTFVPAIALDQTLDAIAALARNNSQANAERLAQLLGVKLAPKQELDMFGEPIQHQELDMFGDPIQSQGFDLFGDPIQDGDDSPVEDLPRLAVVELPLSKLTLSEDVPQFKSGADDESGVVEALGGKFDRTGVAPIQIWERTDGRLEIISGRHRTDLARRSGEKTIPAQVHKESEGFTAKQAMMLDAELNIRDGQGKVKDYVDYFTHSEISEDEADKRGLLARHIGQRAFTIASKGSEELKTLHRNEIISDQAAAEIANIAPSNSAMQAVGLRVLQEHKPLNNALNTIRAVMALTREKGQEPDTFDLFGFDDSALKEAEAMARIASRKQRQINEQLTAIKGAVKNPKAAAKHGVIVENQADALEKVKTMTALKSRWDNWSSHADLLAEVRQEIAEKGGYDSVMSEDDYFDEYDSLAMPSMTDYDVVDVDTIEIKLNPLAYQWRNNVTGDGTEKGRVVSGTFNYDSQPPLILHRRLSGRIYLADGHHRYKMAKASHAPIVKAIVLDEHDGYTVPAVRVLCGFLNLRKEALVKDRVKLPMVNMAKTADLLRKAVEAEMGW